MKPLSREKWFTNGYAVGLFSGTSGYRIVVWRPRGGDEQNCLDTRVKTRTLAIQIFNRLCQEYEAK